MDSDIPVHGSLTDENFGFGFNDENFSDRLLRIEIVGGSSDSCSDEAEECTSITDWNRPRKRGRKDIKKESDGCPSGYKLGHEGEAIAEEALRGDEEEDITSVPNSGMEGSKVIRVEEIHISSIILAAKSPFFFKLFTNGMKESKQRDVTLRINASEEAAFMELLKFMYFNAVSVETTHALLDVLMAADKYEVPSCMSYCSKLLQNFPMTRESALLYLELPSSLLMSKSVQALTNAAKQFLAAHFKDITKYKEEVMSMPLVGIEAILSSDDLEIISEDLVYDFILEWARTHYPLLEERREIMGSRLANFIRFPFMTYQKLKTILTCNDFELEIRSKIVLKALLFKAESPQMQRSLATVNRNYIERTQMLK